MPFANIDLARARVWREINDAGSTHTHIAEIVSLALQEEARSLAAYPLTPEYAKAPRVTKDRIAQVLAPWMYRDATATVNDQGEFVFVAPSPAIDTILSVQAYGIEFWNVESTHGRRSAHDPVNLEPHLGIRGNSYYLEPLGDYSNLITGQVVIHYTPVMTDAIVILVHTDLEDALIFGAGARLLAQREPETAKVLQERRTGALIGVAE